MCTRCGITIPYPPLNEVPVDEFDAACKIHDHCYDDAIESGCNWLDEYVWQYKWHMDENSQVSSIQYKCFLIHTSVTVRCTHLR